MKPRKVLRACRILKVVSKSRLVNAAFAQLGRAGLLVNDGNKRQRKRLVFSRPVLAPELQLQDCRELGDWPVPKVSREVDDVLQ